ncbi:MAG: tetratricopeptide repeat protein [Opitutaceae bacterium]
MPVPPSRPISFAPGFLRFAAALALCVASSTAQAQPGGEKKVPHNASESTQKAFSALTPLQATSNWDGMLQLLDGLTLTPGSYDEALVLDMKAKLYAQKNQYAKAIAPWERVVQLADQHGYFPEKQVNDIVFFLAQLIASEGGSSKDPQVQQQNYSKALVYFKRFLDKTPKPTPEALSTYASILFFRATADPKNVDQAMLKEARAVIDRGLTSTIKPKESFYQLLLTLMQQQNDLAGSAEIFELLLKQNPAKKDYWATLMAIYLQLSDKAAKEKDTELSRSLQVRAITTVERAQALGYLNTPKDNFNLVSLYLMANQFTKGTELLYNGMKKGTIDSEPYNWRILGRYYQEANQNDSAIKVLKEATTLFPKNGEIEVNIAQMYLQSEKNVEALKHAKLAADKGNFEGTKPYSVYYLIAYTAFDLGELDEAMKAIEAAEKYEEHKKDAQFARLKDVVKEAIAEREAKLHPKETAPKKQPSAPPKKETPAATQAPVKK